MENWQELFGAGVKIEDAKSVQPGLAYGKDLAHCHAYVARTVWPTA